MIPENYASLYDSPTQRPSASRLFQKVFLTPAKKIIFNQNSYNTFRGQSFEKNELKSVYQDRNVIATLVVSEDNSEYLKFSFPNLKIYRIHNSIHQGLFSYQGNKRNQICFMPRKNRDHALQVINLLKFKGELNGFDIVPIEGKTEKETASIMREALIFLSFGYPEGSPLPPAEAMSCGCIVIGYHGMGGREFFKTDFCFSVEMGDITGFAKTVAAVLKLYRENPQILRQMGLNAADYINKHYSVEQERKDIIDCWNAILGCSD